MSAVFLTHVTESRQKFAQTFENVSVNAAFLGYFWIWVGVLASIQESIVNEAILMPRDIVARQDLRETCTSNGNAGSR